MRERSYILMLNLVLRTFPVPPYFTGTLSERGCLMLCTVTRVSKREWTFFCRECCAYTDLHRRKLIPRVAAILKNRENAVDLYRTIFLRPSAYLEHLPVFEVLRRSFKDKLGSCGVNELFWRVIPGHF